MMGFKMDVRGKLQNIAFATSVVTSMGATIGAAEMHAQAHTQQGIQATAQAAVNASCRLPSNDFEPPCTAGTEAVVDKMLKATVTARDIEADALAMSVNSGLVAVGAAAAALATRRRKEAEQKKDVGASR